MRGPALGQAILHRLHPRQWGPIPVFLGLALALRILLGGALPPPDPRLLLPGAAFLLGIYLLGPIPWQWGARGQGRPSLLRGIFQALGWNAAWIGLIVLGAWAWQRGSPADLPVQPFLFQLARRAHVSVWLLQGALVLPMAFLVGWLIAAKEAAEAEQQHAQLRQATLEISARQAQVQALQAQLDPHVLYNALGGLSELARRDPVRTERALLDLADLYRGITALGRREWIQLGEERALLERQLGVESLRLGNRLEVHWDWPAELDSLEVPPLLVQPLVENAVKHGLSPREDGGELTLTATRVPAGGLRIEIANTGVELDPAWQQGTGLSNLAARLTLLGGNHGLELRQDGAWTRATLTLAVRG